MNNSLSDNVYFIERAFNYVNTSKINIIDWTSNNFSPKTKYLIIIDKVQLTGSKYQNKLKRKEEKLNMGYMGMAQFSIRLP